MPVNVSNGRMKPFSNHDEHCGFPAHFFFFLATCGVSSKPAPGRAQGREKRGERGGRSCLPSEILVYPCLEPDDSDFESIELCVKLDCSFGHGFHFCSPFVSLCLSSVCYCKPYATILKVITCLFIYTYFLLLLLFWKLVIHLLLI